MTTQEKNKAIAEWLGYKCTVHPAAPNMVWAEINTSYEEQWHPDENRNQQKLIEDKLIKDGWNISWSYRQRDESWLIIIKIILTDNYFYKENKSKDIAFIDAVIELIKQK